MATPTANASAAAQKDSEWDEAKIDDAQKRLKEMFLQVYLPSTGILSI